MVQVWTRRCGKYRTLLQIPKYGAQSESGKDFFETQLRVYVPGLGALLSFIRSKTIRCRKRQRKSAFRFRLPRRGSFTPKRPSANRKCCARSTSPVVLITRALTGIGRATAVALAREAPASLSPAVVSRKVKSEIEEIGEKQCQRNWKERLHSLRAAHAALVLRSRNVWPRMERTWPSHTRKVPMRLRRSSRRLNAPAEKRSQFRRTPLMPTPSMPRSKRPSRPSAGSTCL